MLQFKLPFVLAAAMVATPETTVESVFGEQPGADYDIALNVPTQQDTPTQKDIMTDPLAVKPPEDSKDAIPNPRYEVPVGLEECEGKAQKRGRYVPTICIRGDIGAILEPEFLMPKQAIHGPFWREALRGWAGHPPGPDLLEEPDLPKALPSTPPAPVSQPPLPMVLR